MGWWRASLADSLGSQYGRSQNMVGICMAGLVCHPIRAPVIWLGRGLKRWPFLQLPFWIPNKLLREFLPQSSTIIHDRSLHVNLFNLEPLETPHYKTQFERMQDPTGWWQVSLTSLQYRKQQNVTCTQTWEPATWQSRRPMAGIGRSVLSPWRQKSSFQLITWRSLDHQLGDHRM